MRGSFWFALALAVTPAIAHAQPAPAPAAVVARATQATTVAWNASQAAEQRVLQRAGTRALLASTYDTQLKSVDRLKQQRASWRRDRELRDDLAAANETAKQLAAATSSLALAQQQLATARRQLLATIDAELALGPTVARAQQLASAKAKVAPPAKQARRIVLPDTAIDPLADPEELDQQAAALRESEAELQRQVASLESQEHELEHTAALRSAHDRTLELDNRDDNQPRRTGSKAVTLANEATVDAAPNDPTNPRGETDSAGGTLGTAPGYETQARVELADIVDATTIDSLARAQRSGDPATRAAAAKATRDAVAARLEQLRKKRLEVEARAKALRK